MQFDADLCWDKWMRKHRDATGAARFIGRRLTLGAERHEGADYRWHGLKRGGDAEHPWTVFQWTLSGEGEVRIGRRWMPQRRGQAFLVGVPSDHEYRIAKGAGHWKFLWVAVNPPWQRPNTPWLTHDLIEAAAPFQQSVPVPFDSRLATETLRLMEEAFRGMLDNLFDQERAYLNWAVEVKRHCSALLHPQDRREEMLERAREFYQANKFRSFGVEDFAREHGMSRVRASLLFHKLTGQTLSAFFTELRLKDAIGLLGQGWKLEEIAAETGFADANHFCKVFRRSYHTTPGKFRQMLGVRTLSEVA